MKNVLFVVVCFSLLLFGCSSEVGNPISEDESLNWLKGISWVGEMDDFPNHPSDGEAFYNLSTGTSYIYSSQAGWLTVAKSGIGLNWLGEFSDFPSPYYGKGSAFYHSSLKSSYMYDGTQWVLLARSGENGKSGILFWLGEFSSEPSNPEEGAAYHDTTLRKSRIYTNGKWETIAVDGVGINWIGEMPVAPNNPLNNTAYFNTSDNTAYIWNGYEWTTLSTSSNVSCVLQISWKGNLSTAPEYPSVGWMYYNTSYKKTYMWDGSCWQVIASDGISPSGYLIEWKGSYSEHPLYPEKGWCYYNTSDNSSYIFDGSNWNLMSRGSNKISSQKPNNAALEVYIDGEKFGGGTYDIDINPYNDSEIISKTIEIRNTGEEMIYLCDSSIVSNFQIYQSIDFYCSISVDYSSYLTELEPGQSSWISVTLTPKKGSYLNYRTVSFSIYNTSIVSPLNITLSNAGLLTSKSLTLISDGGIITDKLTFGSVLMDSLKNRFLIVQNDSDSDMDLQGPLVWIDGNDADCFKLTGKYENNLRLTPGNSYSFQVQFLPTSEGEKNAVLHVRKSANTEIEILLNGKGLASHVDFDGVDFIEFEKPFNNGYSPLIVENDNEGFFVIYYRYKSETSFIFEFDSNGNVIDSVECVMEDSPEYAVYKNGFIRLYNYSTNGYFYDYDIAKKQLGSKVKCTDAEFEQDVKKQKNEYSYKKILYYGEYALGLCGGNGEEMDIYAEDELKTTVLKYSSKVSSLTSDFCISGDYLYFVSNGGFNDEISRVNVKALFDDLIANSML